MAEAQATRMIEEDESDMDDLNVWPAPDAINALRALFDAAGHSQACPDNNSAA
jgi:hypothetical protein